MDSDCRRKECLLDGDEEKYGGNKRFAWNGEKL